VLKLQMIKELQLAVIAGGFAIIGALIAYLASLSSIRETYKTSLILNQNQSLRALKEKRVAKLRNLLVEISEIAGQQYSTPKGIPKSPTHANVTITLGFTLRIQALMFHTPPGPVRDAWEKLLNFTNDFFPKQTSMSYKELKIELNNLANHIHDVHSALDAFISVTNGAGVAS
jgi:hypothetical protein